ncbi:hypothetical protein KY290_001480 [Solanum tuberosum]|uniref:Uncharacterized protein n=1 Tax=Solanum tuberosum TaxID=4113 RepID=A0ABQ7WMA0_SOLTU|nr:hypothetical protein KY290_001480 [Solanum tuberosum]
MRFLPQMRAAKKNRDPVQIARESRVPFLSLILSVRESYPIHPDGAISQLLHPSLRNRTDAILYPLRTLRITTPPTLSSKEFEF